jgi:hypothetical protein
MTLILENNEITDQGAEYLAKALENNKVGLILPSTFT